MIESFLLIFQMLTHPAGKISFGFFFRGIVLIYYFIYFDWK